MKILLLVIISLSNYILRAQSDSTSRAGSTQISSDIFQGATYACQTIWLDGGYRICDSTDARYIRKQCRCNESSMKGVSRTTNMNGVVLREWQGPNLASQDSNGVKSTYYSNSKQIQYMESFVNGKLHGELKTYYSNGQLKRNDYYENGEAVVMKCYSSQGADTTYFPYHKTASYPGGQGALLKFVNDHTLYPQKAIEQEIEGTVRLSFVVEKDGSITNIEPTNKTHYLLEEEAIRVISGITYMEPAMFDGIFVRFKMTIPVRFVLKSSKNLREEKRKKRREAKLK
jgi:periplasmic protein TonB